MFATFFGTENFLMYNAMELNDLIFCFFVKELHESRYCSTTEGAPSLATKKIFSGQMPCDIKASITALPCVF